MSLRKQLALIAALILLLPIAAIRFAVALEESLRASQDSSHLELTRFVSEALSSKLSGLPQIHNALTISPMHQHFALDGYLNDWADIPWLTLKNTAHTDKLKLAIADEHLAVAFELTDSSVEFQSPGALSKPYDEILLRLYEAKSSDSQPAINATVHSYRIFSDGPGPLQMGEEGDASVNGVWQTTPNGSVIELRVAIPDPGISAIQLIRRDINKTQGGLFSKTTYPILGSNEQPLPIMYLNSATSRLARSLTPDNTALRIFSAHNKLLFNHDRQLDRNNMESERPWRALIRKLLIGQESGDPAEQPDLSTKSSPFTEWRRAEHASTALLTSYYPLSENRESPGFKPSLWVSLEKQTTAVAALADEAVFQVLSWLSLVTLLFVVILFSYASWLSWRIRRLKKQIVTVMNPDHGFRSGFDSSTVADELGDLSRAFADMLGHLRSYSDYMESFASKLTHECRTPLAIVTSSLQLMTSSANANERNNYLQRALEGASRISALLTAMRQATQLESSIRQQNLQPMDLVPLIKELGAAYQDLYSNHQVITDITCSSAHISGNPDLLAQAVDKLLDNAKDFTPENGQITLGLAKHSEHIELWVENRGKPIPEPLLTQLFQPFISQRESSDRQSEETLHLGMGLVMVKLIADHHQATVQVKNTSDSAAGDDLVADVKEQQSDWCGTKTSANRVRFTLRF